MPGPMKGVTQKEKAQYLTQAGTVVAVRTNLYQTGKYKGFKEIVDRYVIYPPVAIHYDGDEGSCDYLTEENFINAVNSIYPSSDLRENGLKEFVIPDEELNELYREVPEISFKSSPKLLLKCISLKDYTSTPFLRGAVLTAKVKGEHEPISLNLGNRNVRAEVNVGLNIDKQREKLGIKIHIEFGHKFEEEMKALGKNYSRLQERKYELERKINMQYPHDFLRREVLEGIIRNYIGKTGWKRIVSERYDISKKELDKTINEVMEFIKRNDYSDIEKDDFATLRAFKALQKVWNFDICLLVVNYK